MKIDWNDQALRWLSEASAYTGFHRSLRAMLLERVGRRGTLLDLGCGPGLIDMELAQDIERITCVDADRRAVAFLEREAAGRRLDNVRAVCGDARRVRGAWDTVLMVFFGGPEEDAARYFSLCRERLIAVVHTDRTPERLEWDADRAARMGMGDLNVRGEWTAAALEYGQPFRTRDEAARFVTAYGKCAPGEAAEEYLDRRLETIDRDGFKHYLPRLKRFAILTLERITDNI